MARSYSPATFEMYGDASDALITTSRDFALCHLQCRVLWPQHSTLQVAKSEVSGRGYQCVRGIPVHFECRWRVATSHEMKIIFGLYVIISKFGAPRVSALPIRRMDVAGCFKLPSQQQFLASGKTGLSFSWSPVLLISQASIRLVL